MSRDIPYDENATCDICGKKGAFDFMGDFICVECATKALESKKIKKLKEGGY
jgi:uncharacterized membrane protein